jgi:phosphoglycolate phosphatase
LGPITAVLFDKDGTLLDFDATWGPATGEVLAELSGGDGAVFADLAASCRFDPESSWLRPGSPIIGGHTDDFAPAWAARLVTSYDRAFAGRVDALFRRASLKHLTAYADVAAALDRLTQAGIPVGLATNDAEATARAHLDKLAILPQFAFVAGYDSGYGPKPGGCMVEAFARRIGVAIGGVALVGDSPHDVAAARAAGAVPIGITRTGAAADALAHLGVTSVADLPGLLLLLGIDGGGPAGEQVEGIGAG